jgi:hypothetical protein
MGGLGLIYAFIRQRHRRRQRQLTLQVQDGILSTTSFPGTGPLRVSEWRTSRRGFSGSQSCASSGDGSSCARRRALVAPGAMI